MREDDAPEPRTRFGQFITNYSSFLSSSVLGFAGLVATTSYQCNQSRIQQDQAASQQKIAETQAENSWRIERAKILSQNLQVLAAQGGGNVEQRYGVLLSLTRGSILDPELAVSYALELGKDHPDYMRSVLGSTRDKDYRRLAGAFQPTCEQRYGTSKDVPVCAQDRLAERSAAIAELIADETEAALGQKLPGPQALLRDEREVDGNLVRYLWLFTPFLHEMWERRQFEEIGQLESEGRGARLISALALLGAPNGDLATSTEAAQLERMQAERRAWLKEYLLAPGCGAECKGRVAGVLLSGLGRARGGYDEALRALLGRPRTEVVAVLARLGTRLLYCQVDEAAAQGLRDRILVPELLAQLQTGKGPSAEDLVGLLALLPPPPEGDKGRAPYAAVLAALQRTEGGRLQKIFAERQAGRARAQRELPPRMRKANFCAARGGEEEGVPEEAE